MLGAPNNPKQLYLYPKVCRWSASVMPFLPSRHLNDWYPNARYTCLPAPAVQCPRTCIYVHKTHRVMHRKLYAAAGERGSTTSKHPQISQTRQGMRVNAVRRECNTRPITRAHSPALTVAMPDERVGRQRLQLLLQHHALLRVPLHQAAVRVHLYVQGAVYGSIVT